MTRRSGSTSTVSSPTRFLSSHGDALGHECSTASMAYNNLVALSLLTHELRHVGSVYLASQCDLFVI